MGGVSKDINITEGQNPTRHDVQLNAVLTLESKRSRADGSPGLLCFTKMECGPLASIGVGLGGREFEGGIGVVFWKLFKLLSRERLFSRGVRLGAGDKRR